MAGDTTEINEPTEQLVSPAEIREQPTEGLVSGTVGDRCVNCGSSLSSDQRYCVVCGERRGAPRYSLPAPAAASPDAAPRPPREPRRPRVGGAGTTLVAGVATLLLALLVGVLIGHNSANGSTTVTEKGPKIITLGASGAAAPATTSSASAGGASSSKSGSASKGGSKAGNVHSKSAKKSTAPISKKTAKQLSSAASKVTGGSGSAPPTVTVGGSCTSGTAGCNGKTKKFTGSFFGN